MAHEELITMSPGSDLAGLDIFLSSDGAAIAASEVTFEIYDAANVLARGGIPTNPAVGKYLGSGTIPTGSTLGLWRMDWKVTPVGGTLFTASENFTVNAVDVSFGFTASTDETHSVFEACRIDLGDSEGSVFDDSFLRRVLTKALRRLNQKLGLAGVSRGPTGIPGQFGGTRIRTHTISVDLDTGVFSPGGDEYEDLVVLQMEQIIATSEISALKRLNSAGASGPFSVTSATAANDGISVTNADGVIISVSPTRLVQRASLAKFDAQQKTDELNSAVKLFLGRLTSTFSRMVY